MMNFLKVMGITAVVALFSITAAANASESPSLQGTSQPEASSSEVYTSYFTINEDTEVSQSSAPTKRLQSFDTETNHKEFFAPEFDLSYLIKVAKTITVNLLRWNLHEEPPPQPSEKYIRKLHFGRWINDPTDETCMNTRAKVLVRDSLVDVTYRGGKQCVVEDGKWNDPYKGLELTSSREIQIDHMVPLKNAYVSGAWKWDYKTRCLYANYMGYKGHLVSSAAHENMSKGDRAPDEYMPPNEGFTCEYLKTWLIVKLTWKLNMTTDEAAAIDDLINTYRCNRREFKVIEADLRKQREIIRDNLDFCIINKR